MSYEYTKYIGYVIFDEDRLDEYLRDVRAKIEEGLESGYQPDAETEITFVKKEEE